MSEKRRERSSENEYMTTSVGQPIINDSNSLTVGIDGPVVIKDTQLIDKLASFDRERIPERVVHAKGAGAHGYFEVTNSMKNYTVAKVFSEENKKTPVFVRFSTVVGSSGSADTARDPRGFAVKFYTEDGIYDIVGNHIPVFFIRDAIKFADMIHAFKPAPDTGLTDLNRFWDFIGNNPESTHMITFVYSDVGTIKSFRKIEGFGVNTFVWLCPKGKRRFIKYHWKPLAGIETIDRNKAIMFAGINPDIAREDLYDTLEKGEKVQYDLYVQILEPEDACKLSFDILDDTKIWPEDIIPLIKVGRLTLDRNPENFFEETEQVAFSPANLVPGIEASNDKMLQGRLFAYKDTQRHRVGANFEQLEINKPKNKVNNNQQDGPMRYKNIEGAVNYKPNSLDDNKPKVAQSPISEPIFIEGNLVREEIEKTDNFTQAGKRYRSLSKLEKDHLVENIVCDLKCVREDIQDKVLYNLNCADKDLGNRVRRGIKR